MDSHPDRRDSPRIPVGPEYTVSFTAGGEGFRGIRLTNLSLGGCFAVVGGGAAGVFTQGARLAPFVLEHPSFPALPFAGAVAYAMGAHEGDEAAAFLGVGIRFMDVPGEVHNALRAFVEGALGRPWTPT